MKRRNFYVALGAVFAAPTILIKAKKPELLMGIDPAIPGKDTTVCYTQGIVNFIRDNKYPITQATFNKPAQDFINKCMQHKIEREYSLIKRKKWQ